MSHSRQYLTRCIEGHKRVEGNEDVREAQGDKAVERTIRSYQPGGLPTTVLPCSCSVLEDGTIYTVPDHLDGTESACVLYMPTPCSERGCERVAHPGAVRAVTHPQL